MSVTEIKIHHPDEDVIKFVERLLEDAKSGFLKSIIVVTLSAGGSVGSGWQGMDKNNMVMLGEIEVLKRDIMDLRCSLAVDPFTGEIA